MPVATAQVNPFGILCSVGPHVPIPITTGVGAVYSTVVEQHRSIAALISVDRLKSSMKARRCRLADCRA